jgi:hypothetical protein
LAPGGSPSIRGDESLERVGQLLCRVAALEHADVLLGEQGHARCPFDQLRLRLGGQDAPFEQRGKQPRGLVARERSKRERQRVELASTPVGPAGQELGPGGAHEQQGYGVHVVDELVDEVEQVVVGPVQVLEDEHCRPLLRQCLEQPPPRCKGFVA